MSAISERNPRYFFNLLWTKKYQILTFTLILTVLTYCLYFFSKKDYSVVKIRISSFPDQLYLKNLEGFLRFQLLNGEQYSLNFADIESNYIDYTNIVSSYENLYKFFLNQKDVQVFFEKNKIKNQELWVKSNISIKFSYTPRKLSKQLQLSQKNLNLTVAIIFPKNFIKNAPELFNNYILFTSINMKNLIIERVKSNLEIALKSVSEEKKNVIQKYKNNIENNVTQYEQAILNLKKFNQISNENLQNIISKINSNKIALENKTIIIRKDINNPEYIKLLATEVYDLNIDYLYSKGLDLLNIELEDLKSRLKNIANYKGVKELDSEQTRIQNRLNYIDDQKFDDWNPIVEKALVVSKYNNYDKFILILSLFTYFITVIIFIIIRDLI